MTSKYIFSDFQKDIWENNYKAEQDKTIEDTWLRVASSGAAIEKNKKKWTKNFYSILENFKFVPGGRILANIGTGHNAVTLMNCFTHNPRDIDFKNPDSITGIIEMVKAQTLTLKSEGGYGTNFSYIRPRGTIIRGIGVAHPGVIKYMELWDKSSDIITKGSDEIRGKIPENVTMKKKIRKGAMMGVLSVWHPDIEDFITAKLTPNRLTKFNLSVGITQGFMDAVQNDKIWELKFPDISFNKYDTEWTGDILDWEKKNYPVVVYEKIKARKLWDIITHATYTRNEPGILFLDLANQLNPLYYAERILQSNPCGEILMSTGVCNLGSLNLVKFIKKTESEIEFDFVAYKDAIRKAVRFLDNINDITPLPLEDYSLSLKQKRRIGLGVMGLGSLHFMLGLRYGSAESKAFVKKLFKIKAEEEILSSAILGQEKGNFELFDKTKYFNSYWWKNLDIDKNLKKDVEKIGFMRNSHRSANAPTGTIAILAGIISGGIEPIFMKEYIRWTIVIGREKTSLKKKGFNFPDVSKGEWFETTYLKFVKKGDEEVLKGNFEGTDYEVDKNRGLIKAVPVEDYGWKFVKENNLLKEDSSIYDTTEKLAVENHIDILKIVSHYTDMNSSKTVNLPNDYSFNEFKNIYLDAYKSNIKGMTTYRAGTMTAVLEQKKELKEEQNELEGLFKSANGSVLKKLNIKLPTEYYAKGYILRDAHTRTKWYVNLAFADSSLKNPFALFVTTNSKESSEVAQHTINSMEELATKKNIDIDLIKYQRDKYSGQSNVTKIARAIGFCLRHNIPILDIVSVLDDDNYAFSSFIFHIKKLLLKFVPEGTKVNGEKCPNCKGTLIYQEGCYVCLDCGYSKCS